MPRKRGRQLVLVVEDNPDDWEIYGKILWYNGFDVVHAWNGAEGLRAAEDQHPDLVLLDLGLPDIDGLELCRRVKQRSRTGQIPVVALTCRAETECGREAREAGCDRYLEKPRSPTDVLHEVEEVIGKPPPGGMGPPPEGPRLH